MLVILGIMAGLIFLLYSVYFIRIFKGNPEELEMQMMRSLADWIIRKKASAKLYIWTMYTVSVLVEVLYFYLAMVYIQNPVMRILTGLFILFEINHLLGIWYNLKRFFRGQYLLSQIFHWGRERSSAVLFFTHAFMVLAILSAFV
jgi:hypothetical protein